MEEGEICRFFKLWICVLLSLCYSYFAAKIIPRGGYLRLLGLSPTIITFLFLPLTLTSLTLTGFTSFFIAWLANFKLLLFAFSIGPLSSHENSLPKFIALACLPIKIQTLNIHKTNHQIQNQNRRRDLLVHVAKTSILILLMLRSQFRDSILILYLQMYLSLETALVIVSILAKISLKIELCPPFHHPYLATSLQDFWSRRWNLMVVDVLRPAVYLPVRRFWIGLLGQDLAHIPAIIITFGVSGLMHELIFFYLVRERPTWGATGFFLLHGVCVSMEIVVKKKKWVGISPAASWGLTMGIVVGTGLWMFTPQLKRLGMGDKWFEEFEMFMGSMKNVCDLVITNIYGS